MKSGMFIVITMLITIALILTLYVMATTNRPSGIAQLTNYTGKAKLVIEIISLNNMSLGFNYTPSYYTVRVLYSRDPAIKEGVDYKFEIDEEQTGYYGITGGITPKELVDGAIIGIDNYDLNSSKLSSYYLSLYDFDGNKISVGVGADPKDKNAWDNAWKQKIMILN